MMALREPGQIGRSRERLEIQTAAAIESILASKGPRPDTQIYLDDCCELAAQAFDSPLALGRIGQRDRRVESTWRDPAQPVEQWIWIARAVSTEAVQSASPSGRLIHARESGPRVVAIAAPLFDRDFNVVGSLCVFAQAATESIEIALLDQLSILAATTSACMPWPETEAESSPSDSATTESTSIGNTGGSRSSEEYAFQLAASLRERTGAATVAIAATTRGRVHLLALSDIDSLTLTNPGTEALQQALAESLDLTRSVVAQDEAAAFADTEIARNTPLHQRWRSELGAHAVLSVPISSPYGEPALIGFAWTSPQGLTPDQARQIRALATPAGQTICLLRRSQRGLLQHARDVYRESRGSLGNPQARLRIAIWSMVTLLALWLLLGEMRHEVVVPATLAPRRVVHLTSPFEGRIAEVLATEGLELAADAVICRMDTSDLELANAQLGIDAESAALQAQQAVATGDRVLGELLQARLQEIRHQIQILERKIQSATLRAPSAGLILRGDLSQRVGQIVPLGETLFEFLPSMDNPTRLEIEVPQAYASQVRAGTKLRFACDAHPGQRLNYVVRWVRPTADARSGANVYIVRAELESPAACPAWLRVGMEGSAALDLGVEPAWRVVFDSAYRFAHAEFWL